MTRAQDEGQEQECDNCAGSGIFGLSVCIVCGGKKKVPVAIPDPPARLPDEFCGHEHDDAGCSKCKPEGADPSVPRGQEELELKYRRLLWLTHGHNGPALYGDDGEMQCHDCAPAYDYRRMPLADLERAVFEAKLKAMQPSSLEALAHAPQDAVIRRLEAVEADPVAYRTLEEYRALALDALRLLRGPAQPVPRDEVMREIERALDAAWRDIHEWVQFAKRQQKELPDCDHLPCGPTTAGIEASERILKWIGEATRSLELLQGTA